MTVVIDTREPYEEVGDNMAEVGFFDWRFEALNEPEHPKTDYLVGDEEKLAIQRKEVNDFVGSIGDLGEELHEMRQSDHHDMTALLIEGSWKVTQKNIALRRGRTLKEVVSMDVWHRFLLSQQARGTMFIRSTCLAETSYLIQSLDGWLQKMKTPPLDTITSPDMILQLVPGIGPQTAGTLVDGDEGFGSAYEALLHIGEWEDVDGIGPKTQERAIQFFKKEKLHD